MRIDPYFYKQPALAFVEDLRKPVHVEKPLGFGRGYPGEGEISASEAYVVNCFDDKEGLLETAVCDFQRFLEIYDVKGHRYPIVLKEASTETFEAHRIHVNEKECIVEAADTEGIRRALIYIEDEMSRREGAILPLGTISRKPVIRTRITRGFFAPTNRPPKNIDELADDVDYYPEEYLNRLAHDGTNGLWIYTKFKELLPSEQFPEYGRDWEKRIEKLRKVVDKCKRYGVKVYVFGVEPAALVPDMADRYQDAVGYLTKDANYTLCTYSEKGQAYCIETTRKLLELIPELGGIINITDGERFTSCSSAYHYERCPRCRLHTKGEVLAHTVDLFMEGIRRSGTKAEFISWTYGHRSWDRKDIQEYVSCAPKDAMLMENFDDAGYTEQLGRTRQAIDYWLSYVGPSQMFEGAAQKAVEAGRHMFAKMQVCCSHEMATVPYIPVPGILFNKYAGAARYGVEGIMQCWYFGNYPSLMSKAAGELSFLSDFSHKEKFLEQLAGIYYGKRAREAVDAWKCFEEGYKNYPVNIMFSYYGPMHDGVVWDLALQPKNTSLPRSWQLLDKPDGDRIGECLQSGHTLEEAVILAENMCAEWEKGLLKLPKQGPKEQEHVVSAIAVLLRSGRNILQFYAMRKHLLKGEGDAEKLLQSMEELVEKEIINSQQMTALCRKDSRLGYHSEAEGYKFFPEKLEHRMEGLRRLKEQEFAPARANMAQGKAPVSFGPGASDKVYGLLMGGIEEAPFEVISEQAAFRAAYDEEMLYMELKGGQSDTSFLIYFEYEPMWPAPGIRVENGQITLASWALSHQSVFGERIQQELDKYQLLKYDPKQGDYILAISGEKSGWTADRPLRVFLAANAVSWVKEDEPVHTLGKADTSPGEYGWLIPSNH